MTKGTVSFTVMIKCSEAVEKLNEYGEPYRETFKAGKWEEEDPNLESWDIAGTTEHLESVLDCYKSEYPNVQFEGKVVKKMVSYVDIEEEINDY